MNPVFWRLPGPARYADRIRHDLLDGFSVMAILSPLTPDGLLYELQGAMEEGGFGWRQLYDRPDQRPPAVWLAEQLGEELPMSAGAVEFYNMPAAMGTTFVMTDLPNDPAILGRWAGFVEQHAQLSRAATSTMSPRFLFLWPDGHSLPESDVNLTLHPWSDIVDSTDIHLYAALLLRRSGQTNYNRSLMVALAAKLSGGDPHLCRELCVRDLAELLEPLPKLREYADRLGWTATSKPSVRDGSLLCVDGVVREHPAFLAVCERARDISILVWSAQLGVLMPMMEERRQEIVEKVAGYLTVPDDLPKYKAVDDIQDLEISSICFQLLNHPGPVPRDVKDQVKRLKKVRDFLSHRKALPADLLLDEGTIRSLAKGG